MFWRMGLMLFLNIILPKISWGLGQRPSEAGQPEAAKWRRVALLYFSTGLESLKLSKLVISIVFITASFSSGFCIRWGLNS
jgi:hypothetical protein